MSLPPRIVVISLGNPNALFNTFHSAGHHALAGLQTHIHPAQPPLRRSAHGAQPCMASEGAQYTLIQSPTFMNVSGPFVARVWKETATQAAREDRGAGMVVVHDELEKEFGHVAMRSWDRGRRGHNGLRSIDAALSYKQWLDRGVQWRTVGVGIGRPLSRESASIQEFVLSKLGRTQLEVLKGTGAQVWDLISRFEREWVEELKTAS